MTASDKAAYYKRINSLVKIPSRESMNTGIDPARQSVMLNLFGRPGAVKTRNCLATHLVSPKLRRHIITSNVGPFRVTGLSPALEDLRRIFDIVEAKDPELYAYIETAGVFCCRLVRGSDTYWSNHSWGTAIDLHFGEGVDALGDGRCYQGMLDLYRTGAFHKFGWYWGAEFSREDSMHFEASDSRVRYYAKKLGLS
jgi:hypothetical protein